MKAIQAKNWYKTGYDDVIIHRVSSCGNYGFYYGTNADIESRIHRKQLYALCNTEQSLTALAEDTIDAETNIPAARLERSLMARRRKAEQKVKSIKNGAAGPSWYHNVVDITPVAIAAYTGGISGLVALAITLYNYVL
tara:strand:+ start:959 stop:1372 length:414 start_codon:yes stop_codon:yes gene_type:complete